MLLEEGVCYMSITPTEKETLGQLGTNFIHFLNLILSIKLG